MLQVASRVLGFQKRDNGTLFEQLLGDATIPLDGAKFHRAEEFLRGNLQRMIHTANGARIPLLLTTPVVNLRSQSPIASLSREALSAHESAAWHTAMDLGTELLRKNNHLAAHAFDQPGPLTTVTPCWLSVADNAWRVSIAGRMHWSRTRQLATWMDIVRAPSSFAKIMADVARNARSDSFVRF